MQHIFLVPFAAAALLLLLFEQGKERGGEGEREWGRGWQSCTVVRETSMTGLELLLQCAPSYSHGHMIRYRLYPMEQVI